MARPSWVVQTAHKASNIYYPARAEKFAKSYFRLVLFDTVVSSLTVRGYLNMNVHSVKWNKM